MYTAVVVSGRLATPRTIYQCLIIIIFERTNISRTGRLPAPRSFRTDIHFFLRIDLIFSGTFLVCFLLLWNANCTIVVVNWVLRARHDHPSARCSIKFFIKLLLNIRLSFLPRTRSSVHRIKSYHHRTVQPCRALKIKRRRGRKPFTPRYVRNGRLNRHFNLLVILQQYQYLCVASGVVSAIVRVVSTRPGFDYSSCVWLNGLKWKSHCYLRLFNVAYFAATIVGIFVFKLDLWYLYTLY